MGVTTAQISMLNMTFVATIEPENLKFVLAGGFRGFSLGDMRKRSMRPFWGRGIFTTDGVEWVLCLFILLSLGDFFWVCCNGLCIVRCAECGCLCSSS